jgi:hypothetical protein
MPHRPYREVLIALAALAIGWLAHDSRPVHAAEPPAVYYQFSGEGPGTSLSVYNPADGTIYVYQGITTGNSNRYCTYSLRLGKLGGPIDRQNCPIGSLLR